MKILIKVLSMGFFYIVYSFVIKNTYLALFLAWITIMMINIQGEDK